MKETRDVFTYHSADHVASERFTSIRKAANILFNAIYENGGNEHDMARATEKLRECVFYAIASIAIPEVE